MARVGKEWLFSNNSMIWIFIITGICRVLNAQGKLGNQKPPDILEVKIEDRPAYVVVIKNLKLQ